MHADPGRERVRPLATDGLSLAGGERRKKRLEARVTGVLPVELLVRTLEVAACAEEFPFRFGREGDVNRGAAGTPTHVRERIGEMRAHGIGLRARSREQPAACCRRERHGHLELRIIAASGALIGLRPAMIENVFAARMGFHVAGDGAEQAALRIFGKKVQRLPSGARADRLRQLERGQEIVGNKRVVPIS